MPTLTDIDLATPRCLGVKLVPSSPGGRGRLHVPCYAPLHHELGANEWHCACGRTQSGAAIAARGQDVD
jgi:hypothetical protein